jgi:HPt (histidine-containing phosphotransfer) domain-containing protein
MDLDQQQLKEKALLLLRRERELFDMRTKHEQVTLWLRLTQLLPQLFDHNLPEVEIYARLRKSLQSGLRLQQVLFVAIDPPWLRAIAPQAAPRPLSPELVGFLADKRAGVCNDPAEPEAAALAAAVGLHRFLWSVIPLSGARSVLLVAGYDQRLAPFQRPFEAGDAAHLENVAQHIQTLLGNLSLLHELEQSNESLESRVEERTLALAQRTRDMRLVLDNVDQGFLTIDARGRLAQERSTIVDRWFGPFTGQPSFVDYIGRIDPGYAEAFALGYEALLDDVLPQDLLLEQMPTRLSSATRQYHCTYSSLPGKDVPAGLLIVIRDVTEQLRLTQEEAEHREQFALFQALTRDRVGYLAFAEETSQCIERLCAGAFDFQTSRRLLHKLKGNAAVIGANVIADLCHRAEAELEQEQTIAPRATFDLRRHWLVITQALATFVDEHDRPAVEIQRDEIVRLVQEIRQGAPPDVLVARLASWEREPVDKPLGRLGDYARSLAQRLGKPAPAVTISAAAVRVDRQRWAGLWSALAQLVRNAIDHGIEPAAERAAAAKSAAGRLQLRAIAARQDLVVEIEDDGRGIDWSRVAQIARQRGLPCEGEADLVDALLSPGFSTRGSASMTSGRGVGLAVVKSEVAALGGRITVTSRPGQGCCWSLTFPAQGQIAALR